MHGVPLAGKELNDMLTLLSRLVYYVSSLSFMFPVTMRQQLVWFKKMMNA
jgi:hypothetical protein